MKFFNQAHIIEKILLFVSLCILIAIPFQTLNPFNNQMFEFHDITQASRIFDFSLNLKNGIFPPRIAPTFSYGLGYPVFNFYAPFAYWITSFIHIIGFDIVSSLKFSFLFAFLLSFVGMYIFLKNFFNIHSSLLGAFVYTLCPYFAAQIFVRGNLAEVWFMALLPFALHLLTIASTHSIPLLLVTPLLLSALFTVHNIFSLLSVAIVIIYASFFTHRKLLYGLITIGLLLSSYFLIPAVIESSSTYATTVAKMTNYKDHFLCPIQLWYSPWGFGGSGKDCVNDGMSFMLGKMAIAFTTIGLALFVSSFFIFKKNYKSHTQYITTGIVVMTIGSILLALYQSQFIWTLFEPILSLFQFPWRFLLLTMFGFGFISAYGIHAIPWKWMQYVGITIGIIGLIVINTKYFKNITIPTQEYNQKFVSKKFIMQDVAYLVPEYVPISVDYSYWKNLNTDSNEKIKEKLSNEAIVTGSQIQNFKVIQNTPFKKKITFESLQNTSITLHIHTMKNWVVKINGKTITIKSVDTLGRPIIDIMKSSKTIVEIHYRQTALQLFANSITLFTLISYSLFIAREKLIH